VIELRLAHLERNNSRRPYNHATRLPDRRIMMLVGAIILDRLRAGNSSTADIDLSAVLASPVLQSRPATVGTAESRPRTGIIDDHSLLLEDKFAAAALGGGLDDTFPLCGWLFVLLKARFSCALRRMGQRDEATGRQ
jgi:hypothetical protein